jgi:hypothetical protein
MPTPIKSQAIPLSKKKKRKLNYYEISDKDTVKRTRKLKGRQK